MTAIEQAIAANVQRFITAIGDGVTDLQRKAAQRAAELVVLADSYRSRALAGEAIDLGQLMTLEDAAGHAVAELRLPAAKAPQPQALTVEFVDGDPALGFRTKEERFEERVREEVERRLAQRSPASSPSPDVVAFRAPSDPRAVRLEERQWPMMGNGGGQNPDVCKSGPEYR
jgi:hypothetical protein